MPEDFMDIPTGAPLTKTSRAREAVNIPPGITLATLRDGYPWRTHGSCQAFVEHSAVANQWEWEVTSGREDGAFTAFTALTGAARYLHRALADLLNAEARLLREAFLRTPRNDYTTIPELRTIVDVEALRRLAQPPRVEMAETTRSALDAVIAGHGTFTGVSVDTLDAGTIVDWAGIPIRYDESVPPGQVRITGTNDGDIHQGVDGSVLERLWRGAGPVPEASDEPSARHGYEMGRAAIATFERTLLYEDIMDTDPF